MAFVSELAGKPVTDIQGRQLGVLSDLVARERGDFPHPVIEAIEVELGNQKKLLPYSDVAALLSAAVPLKCSQDRLGTFHRQADDFSLIYDVLDKQIIDTDGARVVRVNDIELLHVNDQVVVSNVDIGLPGLLRRMGLGRLSTGLSRQFRHLFRESVISWEYVELLSRDPFMRLRVPVEKLAELHPADMAEILTDLSQTEGGELLDSLDIKQLADTLEEVEPDLQVSLVESMSDEKVADVLEEMSPDEAADLLAELPPERSEDLLELMEDDDAADVRRLLAYEEDTAGGLMTTEYAAVWQHFTTAKAIEHLRTTARETEQIFYVYVVDPENHLEGVFSLSDLVLANPETPVTEYMHKRLVSVQPDETQEELAHLIAKYNLLALPVVDQENHLLGIITADDALDKIIPTAWKKRLPRFFR